MKNKYASQTAQRLSKKVILVIVSALAFCAPLGMLLADSCLGHTTWTAGSGDWFVGTNWSNDVPNSTTGAPINNGGTATIGSTGAVSCDLTLGANATDSGTVVVDHGGLSISFDAAVGEYGKGVLTIKNGGTVTAALAAIATLQNISGSASVGTVSVDGGSFTVSGGIYVGGQASGAGGTGLLTVTNGGTVTAASVHAYGSGTLTGNGTVSTTNGTTVEGTISRTVGTLTISGNLGLTSSATTQYGVTPQDLNQVEVSVSGTASLNGRLSVTMTGTFTPGTQFTLLHSSGTLTGAFSGGVSITYPTNQCFMPQITYDYVGNHVYLYLFPTCS